MSTHYSRSTFIVLLFTAGLLTLSALIGQAADYRWTGGGSDDYWSTLDNWEVDSGGWGPASTAPGSGDVATLGAADLTLAGTLELTAPPGFSEYATGRYTLFHLAGGTLDGGFSKVIPPDRMTAEIDDTSGDLVLILVKKPTGTSILVR